MSTLAVLFVLGLVAGPARGDEPSDPSGEWTPFRADESMSRWARGVAAAELAPERRLRRLYRALQSTARRISDGDQVTATAPEALARRRANCLGFANLMVALGRSAEIPVRFALVPEIRRRERRGELRVVHRHVAAVWLDGDRALLLEPRGIEERDTPSLVVLSDRHATALYFSNRGAEALLAGRRSDAVEALRRAVRLAPRLAVLRDNLATVERGLGQGRRRD